MNATRGWVLMEELGDLKLRFQAVVKPPMWVLGTEFESSGKPANASLLLSRLFSPTRYICLLVLFFETRFLCVALDVLKLSP